MGGIHLRVDDQITQQLTVAAKLLENEISDQVGTAVHLVADLSTWRGEAADAFRGAMSAWQARMSLQLTALTLSSWAIGTAQRAFDAREQATTSGFDYMASGLGG
ncbi:MAG: WXG100 family type VII secretion target [Propionibacteriaceae bacterium]|jgi:uncharacterized protein YukE|nr:WXG100 family type VII secretion target [Propionibacteriaceae bacterium]